MKKHIDKARTASDHKSKDRVKKTGEVFTTPELINEMLDQLPEEIWQPGKTVLEPAAGDGNFVVEILKRKLAAGCTPTQAIEDVYAVEYMKDNVEAMKHRVLEMIGDTAIHRQIVDDHIAYANTLDENDTSEGRKFPRWLRETPSIEDFFS
jgi:phospholipid N-methyltransferase